MDLRYLEEMEGRDETHLPLGRRNIGLEAGMAAQQQATTGKPKPRETVDEGAMGRYLARIQKFVTDKRPHPRLRHHALWVLHNCVAHPILGLTASDPAIEFHELTSAWLNHVKPPVQSGSVTYRQLRATRPDIKHPGLWVFHNLFAHMAIGLCPTKFTFEMHDWSARVMEVESWV